MAAINPPNNQHNIALAIIISERQLFFKEETRQRQELETEENQVWQRIKKYQRDRRFLAQNPLNRAAYLQTQTDKRAEERISDISDELRRRKLEHLMEYLCNGRRQAARDVEVPAKPIAVTEEQIAFLDEVNSSQRCRSYHESLARAMSENPEAPFRLASNINEVVTRGAPNETGHDYHRVVVGPPVGSRSDMTVIIPTETTDANPGETTTTPTSHHIFVLFFIVGGWTHYGLYIGASQRIATTTSPTWVLRELKKENWTSKA